MHAIIYASKQSYNISNTYLGLGMLPVRHECWYFWKPLLIFLGRLFCARLGDDICVDIKVFFHKDILGQQNKMMRHVNCSPCTIKLLLAFSS